MKLLQKILPPVYLIIFLLLMLLLHHFFPVMKIISDHYANAGLPVIILGILSTGLGAGTFKKADTPVKPFEPSTALVVHGIYRFTRNPMYLGLVLILVGTAVFMGTLSPFFVIPVFVIIVQEGYIRHEEVFLEKIFGEAYREYKSRVRRWL